MIKAAEDKIKEIEGYYEQGLLSRDEKRTKLLKYGRMLNQN